MSGIHDLRTRWNALVDHACRHDGPAVTRCERCCWEALAALCADPTGTMSEAPDDETRCAVCARPLYERRQDGCVRGGCSKQPLPKRFYALKRVCVEYQLVVVDTGTEHRFYSSPENHR
jgi:hypothetical protein